MYNFDLGKKFPTIIPAYIEISKNSNIKYEWNDEKQVLMLDRILHSSVMYPENYGFIPQTLCDDGDPLDVIILSDHVLQPGTIAYIRPICYLNMSDEKGTDEKMVAILDSDPSFQHYSDLEHIPRHKLNQIKVFFETYKNLEPNKWVKVDNWENYEKTIKLIKNSHENYKKNNMNKIE
jgi:inorganic pyrophosphatase